jgi:hypothetical protein
MDKFCLLSRVELGMVCHMYRFCVNIRKGRQERNGKIYSCQCEAEVSKGCNLGRKLDTASILP